jgi:hypothetical protein
MHSYTTELDHPIPVRVMLEKLLNDLADLDRAAAQNQPDLKVLRDKIDNVLMLTAATLDVAEAPTQAQLAARRRDPV